MNQLRKLILLEGLPPESKEEMENFGTVPSLRAKVWRILLNVRRINAKSYIDLVKKGPNLKFVPGSNQETFYDKIRKDTNRTFKNDSAFIKRVPEEVLIRFLNALTHYFDEGNVLS